MHRPVREHKRTGFPQNRGSRCDQTYLFFCKQGGGEVAFASVREDHNNPLALVFGTGGDLSGCPQGRAGGNAHQNAVSIVFMLCGWKRGQKGQRQHRDRETAKR